MTLTIGFDAKRVVRNRTGLGAYGRTLVADLARQAGANDLQLRLYAPDAGHNDLRLQLPLDEERLSLHLPQMPPLAAHLPFARSYWRSHTITRQLRADGVQLFHGLSGELPCGLRRAGIAGVVTIHDLIFLRHPEYYNWPDTKIYTWKFHAACREATRIIAISERTRQDIIELGGVSPDRIDLVYQSCNPRYADRLSAAEVQETCQRLHIDGRFVLNVGSVEERKNVALAVRALPLLSREVHLVVVGRHTPYADRMARLAEELGVAHRLHLLHGVSDHDLQALYQQAEVFVYPSRYEGFGIPIIEAAFSRLPVVACTGSCLEEAGGPDSLYVAPDDAEGMAHAIGSLLKGAPQRDRRTQLTRQYVERFRGLDVASQVIDVYRRAAAD